MKTRRVFVDLVFDRAWSIILQSRSHTSIYWGSLWGQTALW